MDDSPMAITSLALLGLLVIFVVLFACHYLGPQAASWVRSNKEEKIGLSKNKLFHANGYMIHSGSEFLLSTSGSFKRFDTVDPDFKQAGQHPAQLTSPLWNLPQADQRIPPQPLRPAPAPLGAAGSKSVTFCFTAQTDSSMPGQGESEPSSMRPVHESHAPCLRTSKPSPIPPAIQAPPPPRLSAPSAAALSASAIPRPLAKRQQVAVQNGSAQLEPTSAMPHSRAAGSQRDHFELRSDCESRSAATNPFLTASEENSTEEEKPNTATETILPPHPLSRFNDNGDPELPPRFTNNEKNPFYCGAAEVHTSKSTQTGAVIENSDPIIEGTHVGNNNNYNSTSASKCPADSADSADSASSAKANLPNQLFRNRSFSETEASDPGLTNFSSKVSAVGLKFSCSNNPFATLTQKVKGPHMLQKTLSEDFLFRNKPGATAPGHSNTTWSFGRSLLRQESQGNIGRYNNSQTSLASVGSSMDSINLERAISCDSVNSESSIILSDLEQPLAQVTGYLCVGIQYDKHSVTTQGMELIVTVMEAKEVVCPLQVDSFDTFVRIYLVPDQAGAMQTKVVSNTLCPSYNESFTFWLRKQQRRHSLWFHLYHNGRAHTLLGEAELEIGEVPRPGTIWIPLSDSRKSNAKWGELMFSLSYLPTAERLTIVVVKARNLKLSVQADSAPSEVQTMFVKIYLMNHVKKVLKKRTSHKRKDRCPIFNESVIFSLPPQSLSTVQLRLTVFGVLEDATVAPLGHVIVGSCATGKGLRHWHQMLSSLRKPVAMWHVLRRATNQPIFTGGAEAVVAAMQSSATRAKRNSIF